MTDQESNESAPAAGGPPHLELYTAFREYVRHEDALTNNRLGWNFTIQGFLFAAYSLALGKMGELIIERAKKDSPVPQITFEMTQLKTAIQAFCAVGFVVSVLVFFGALAAQLAIGSIVNKWCSDHKEYPRPTNGRELLMRFRRRLAGAVSCEVKAEDKKSQPLAPYLPNLTGGGSTAAHYLGFGAPIVIPLVLAFSWGWLYWNALGIRP
jgi:hypothetical protein